VPANNPRTPSFENVLVGLGVVVDQEAVGDVGPSPPTERYGTLVERLDVTDGAGVGSGAS
jgi:hypothetical protein